MRIIEPNQYQPRRPRRWRPFAAVFLLLVLGAGTVNYLRPLPVPVATLNITLPAGSSDPALAWPGSTQAAVAADGYGLLGTNGEMKPLATASIAKVIVALCVLQKQPMQPGEDGPTYTINSEDVKGYQQAITAGGSLLPVTQGEKLTQYQALQALMIPSANNISDSLVRWVFGSQESYRAYATTYLREHGMNQTEIGADASGYDAGTVSTATDLTVLGQLALENPVLMEIAGQSSARLPVAGRVTNYNTILGVNGVTGLKTGNNDANPGAFLFTATVKIGDREVHTTGAVMGAPDLATALRNSADLAGSMQQGFEQIQALSSRQSVGQLKSAWGATSTIITTDAISLIRWKATPVAETHTVDTSKRTGKVGKITVSAGQVKSDTTLALQQPLAGPSFWWRLTRH